MIQDPQRSEELARVLERVSRVKNYIDGAWVESLGSDTVDIINPANGKLLGHTPLGTAQDADAAIQAAKKAFPIWRQTPVIDRVQVLFRLKTLLEEHCEELA